MIEVFRAQNFKCFKDTGPIEIRPVTILLGLNSSGKTSILQALMALKQTLSSRDNLTPLITDGEYVKLGTYTDFSHMHSRQADVTLEWTIPSPQSPYHRFMHRRLEEDCPWITEVRSMTARLTLAQNRKTRLIYVRKYRLSTDNRKLILEVTCGPSGRPQCWRSELPVGQWTPRYWRQWLSRENFHFDLFKQVPLHLGRSWSPEKRFRAIDQGQSAFELTNTWHRLTREAFDHILCLAPLRDYPTRINVVGGETPPDVGLRGESTVNLLLAIRQTAGWSAIQDSISKWLKKCRIADNVRLDSIAKGIVSVRVTDPYLGVESSLADVGFGASQILPVIVQGICSKPNRLLLVEQPEIHLHPSAQAELGDFFIETSQEGKRWVVETHSEHLLLRIQRRIAEGHVDPQDVAIYFIERKRRASRVQRLEIDEYGGIPNWPRDFFAADFYESQARAVAAAKSAHSRRKEGK